jgi:5-dehydro-2-deoxygluconokinase
VTAEKWFVLAIDHRSSFRRWSGDCTGGPVASATLSRLKVVVATALVEAIDSIDSAQAAMLVDDEYGAEAIALAHASGVKVVVPAEKSGLPEFVFEHGDEFAEAIVRSGADAVKALVRYNPSSDPERNTRSRHGLVRLARWCEGSGCPLMLELLVPPSERDLDAAGQPPANFDSELRPALTCAAVDELRRAGLHPAWWKLEGQPNPASFADVAAATGAADAGSGTACLVLGRGAGEEQLARWIREAAATAGFAGFAVGRSLWVDALGGVLLGTTTEEAAAARIAAAYLALVDLYEQAARASTGRAEPQEPR